MELYDRKAWEKEKPIDKGKKGCPLCDIKQIEEYCIWESKSWRVVHNKFPICELKNHMMAIPKRHVLLSKDFSQEELLDLQEVESFLSDFYNGENYFSFVRQSLQARSLEHIHYHYLPGRVRYAAIEEMLKIQGY